MHVPVNALGLFAFCRKTHVCPIKLKHELTALPGCQQLVLTALAESKGFLSLQSNGIKDQVINMNPLHFSLQKYFTTCNSKLLLCSKKAKLKNHLVPLLLAVRKYVRLFVLLPGKPVYLWSVGSISSRVSIGRAMTEVICLNLCCLLEGTALQIDVVSSELPLWISKV